MKINQLAAELLENSRKKYLLFVKQACTEMSDKPNGFAGGHYNT
jgi:hypothetical protein